MPVLPGPRFIVTIATLLCLLIASPTGKAAERWTYASSDNFEVYTTAGPKRAREALVYFERIHAFFEDFLKLSRPPGPPTRLVIFSNPREFRPYRYDETSPAYFVTTTDRDYIVMRALEVDAYPLVVRAYAHVAMRRSNNEFSSWLSDGLAEFFSTLRTEGNKMGLGRVSQGRLNFLKFSREPLIELPRLFALDHNSPEFARQRGLYYGQSWALVHMLLTTDAYRPKVSEFLDEMGKGAAADTAFVGVYGKTLQVVRKDLQYHIENDNFRYFLLDYRDAKPENSYPLRTVDTFEGELVGAGVLSVLTDGAERARAAYEALAKQRPDDLALAEARADFEWRRGDRAAAGALLKRAIELNSQDPKIYRLASQLAAATTAERESYLRTASSLAPDDHDLRLAYATVLLNNSRLPLVVATLAPVKRIDTKFAFRHFQLLAVTYARLDRPDDAKQLAEQAKPYARTDAERTFVEQMIATAERRGAVLAEASRPQPATPEERTAAPSTPATTSSSTESSAFGTGEVTVDGYIRNMFCGTKPPTIEIRTASTTLRLQFDNPDLVRVIGKSTPEIDINCGAQNVKVRVGYNAKSDPSNGTHGVVRVLDYRP